MRIFKGTFLQVKEKMQHCCSTSVSETGGHCFVLFDSMSNKDKKESTIKVPFIGTTMRQSADVKIKSRVPSFVQVSKFFLNPHTPTQLLIFFSLQQSQQYRKRKREREEGIREVSSIHPTLRRKAPIIHFSETEFRNMAKAVLT